MKYMPENMTKLGQTTADKEFSAKLVATRVEDYRPARIWKSTDSTGTLTTYAAPFIDGMFIGNTNARQVTIEVWFDPLPGDDRPESLVWGPVSFDLTGIQTLAAFMSGDTSNAEFDLWVDFCATNRTGLPNYLYAPDGSMLLAPDDSPMYAGYFDPEPAITFNTKILTSFDTVSAEIVQAGLVYPSPIKRLNNPLEGVVLQDDYSMYGNELLNSGNPYILPPNVRVPRTVTGTINTNTDEMLEAYKVFRNKVGLMPIPVRIIEDGTTRWDLYGQFPTRSVSGGRIRSTKSFKIQEVI